MLSPKTLKRHAGLMDDMANACGVDMEEAILRGKMTISDLDDAVLKCTGCAKPDDCQAWLASEEGNASAPPDYCRNARLFETLSGV